MKGRVLYVQPRAHDQKNFQLRSRLEQPVLQVFENVLMKSLHVLHIYRVESSYSFDALHAFANIQFFCNHVTGSIGHVCHFGSHDVSKPGTHICCKFLQTNKCK